MAGQESELAAKFSMPVALGLLLVFGQTDAAAFKARFISDPRVQAIAHIVTVRIDPESDKAYPKHRLARVTIKTESRTYTQEVIFPKGEPENPMGDDELADKYMKNMSTLYSTEQADRIRDMIHHLENINIRELSDILGAPSLT